MKILFVDTTTPDLVVAIIQKDDVKNFTQPNVGVHHSEMLCGAVATALEECGLRFADLDGYACAIGPGSFTGIRIGIATVKGYATACPKPLVAVNCLQAIGHSDSCGCNGKGAINAGNGLYFADYANGVEPCLVAYDDPRAKDAFLADRATQYFDGAANLIRLAFEQGKFDKTLTPLYIRRSQAEEQK